MQIAGWYPASMPFLTTHRGRPYEVRDFPDGGADVVLLPDDAAQLVLRRQTPPPKRRMIATQATVPYPLRRAGVGTAMYELALQRSCKKRLLLRSDRERSPFIEAFWRKQASKGRARCLTRNHAGENNVWDAPLEAELERIASMCSAMHPGDFQAARACARDRADILRGALPAPRHHGRGWPCLFWGLKRRLCKLPQPVDLSEVFR